MKKIQYEESISITDHISIEIYYVLRKKNIMNQHALF